MTSKEQEFLSEFFLFIGCIAGVIGACFQGINFCLAQGVAFCIVAFYWRIKS